MVGGPEGCVCFVVRLRYLRFWILLLGCSYLWCCCGAERTSSSIAPDTQPTMDSDTLKVILDSQSQAFRSALDFVVNQFSLRMSELETIIKELTRSLEFSEAEVGDLQGTTRALQKPRLNSNLSL